MLVLIPVFAFLSQRVNFSCYNLDMRTMPIAQDYFFTATQYLKQHILT